jgi:hypothetical protein
MVFLNWLLPVHGLIYAGLQILVTEFLNGKIVFYTSTFYLFFIPFSF